MLAILFICLVVFAAVSIPIGIAMGLGTLICLIFATNIDPVMIAQNAFAGIDSFSLIGNSVLYARGQLYEVRRNIQAAARSCR